MRAYFLSGKYIVIILSVLIFLAGASFGLWRLYDLPKDATISQGLLGLGSIIVSFFGAILLNYVALQVDVDAISAKLPPRNHHDFRQMDSREAYEHLLTRIRTATALYNTCFSMDVAFLRTNQYRNWLKLLAVSVDRGCLVREVVSSDIRNIVMRECLENVRDPQGSYSAYKLPANVVASDVPLIELALIEHGGSREVIFGWSTGRTTFDGPCFASTDPACVGYFATLFSRLTDVSGKDAPAIVCPDAAPTAV